jgi:hypothetical protein
VGYAAARRAGRSVDVLPGSRAADRLLADSMMARMVARHAAARADGAPASALGEAELMAEILHAERAVAAGRPDSAIARLRRAAVRWEALPYAFGPPGVVKPPRERAAELLLSNGRPAEALAQLDSAERMTPGRTQVALRRARALAALGRDAEARGAYAALDSTWRAAEPTFPFSAEAARGAGRVPAAARAARVVADTLARHRAPRVGARP